MVVTHSHVTELDKESKGTTKKEEYVYQKKKMKEKE
jgi:hypothetical protein